MGMKETKDMDCISAKPLTDSELLQFQDGESDHQVSEHLQSCIHCQQRYEALRDLQNKLGADLYRLHCPSPQELGDYHLRLLPPENLALIKSHAADCLHCTRELHALEGYLDQLKTDLGITPVERIKILVAKLIGGQESSGTGAFAPAMVGVRGGESDARIFEAGDLQLTIVLQSDPDTPGERTLLGLALGTDVGDYSARLMHDGREIANVNLDDLGNFVFHGISSGSYDLILQGLDTEIHVPSITA